MFPKAIPLFRLLGFEIRVDWSWIIIAVLVTWTLAAGVFPSYYPNLPPSTYWSMGVVAAIGLFASIVLHEVGHSVVARHYGLPIRGITLFIFGGVAELEDEPERPKVEFLVAIGGPIVSFVIAVVCFVLAQASGAVGMPAPLVGVIAYLAMINAIVATFNLVPAFPLDGGRILRAALWHWKGSLRYATRITSNIGGGFGIALIALGVYRVVIGDFIGGMWWCLIGLFVRGAAQMSYRQVVLREGLRGVPVGRVMSREPVTVPSSLSLQDLVDDYVYRHHYKMFPVVDGERLVGCITSRDIKEVPREEWRTTEVASVMRQCSPETVIGPDADALAALTTMNQTQNGRLLVTRGERLLGIVTLKDMLKFLSMKLDLEGDEDSRLMGGLGDDQAGFGPRGLGRQSGD